MFLKALQFLSVTWPWSNLHLPCSVSMIYLDSDHSLFKCAWNLPLLVLDFPPTMPLLIYVWTSLVETFCLLCNLNSTQMIVLLGKLVLLPFPSLSLRFDSIILVPWKLSRGRHCHRLVRTGSTSWMGRDWGQARKILSDIGIISIEKNYSFFISVSCQTNWDKGKVT